MRVMLDHAATTPMRPEALAVLSAGLADGVANPSGAHAESRAARRRLDLARERLADLIGCSPHEIVFTSGGTEADNLAVMGVARSARLPGAGGRGPVAGPAAAGREAERPKVVCPETEHPAVREAVLSVGGRTLPVDATGVLDPDALTRALEAAPALVSVMAVNNETGVISDLEVIAEAVSRSPGTRLHTDAVQAGRFLDLAALWKHVDLMSLTGHKLGGPPGLGALVVGDGAELEPLFVGGGQEHERRPGTHPVAAIEAFVTAVELAQVERDEAAATTRRRRDRLAEETLDIGGITPTVPLDLVAAGHCHLSVEGVESEALLFLLDQGGVAASAASACASGAQVASHVLAAMGVAPEQAAGALRLTLAPSTTDADVEHAVAVLADAVMRLRGAR